jgi:hypothetical protein
MSSHSAGGWRTTTPRCGVLLLLLAAAPAPLAAQAAVPAAPAAERYRVQRLSGPIEFDGKSYEPVWEAIAPLPLVMSFPDFGAQPSERTEFRIAHDDEYLYVAARNYDADVRGIRATSLRRDDGSFSNDWFAVNLDTFRDRETALVMGVSPANTRTDAVFSNDGATSNFNWNTFWDARTVVTEDGWHSEIRIPFSSLRFEERDGVVVMGISMWRRIARKNEVITWPGIEHRWGTFSIFKASQMAEIELHGVYRSNPVYVTPYVLAGGSRVNALNNARTDYLAQDRFSREAGLDVKYSPTTNLTLDVTVNTDFAQVEADDQQVNLSRFSLFFPEKRLFFQERSSVFEYGLGGSDQLFYSRRIGLENGEPVRIYGGIRAVGRVGEWDIGLLDMQTAAHGARASENAGVMRVRRRVLNANSYTGGMLTTRMAAGGSADIAAGGDAVLRVGAQDYLSLTLAGTRNAADSIDTGNRAFARARIDRRGIYGLLYQAEVAHVGSSFLPSLGFLARRDHARAAARVAYGVRMPQGSMFLRHSAGVEGAAYRRYADGRLETVDLGADWHVETRGGRSITAVATARHENLLRPFRIATDVSVPAGDYDFGGVRVAYSPTPGALLRINVAGEAGTFFDGSRIAASVSPTWNPNRHVQLSGTYQANRIEFTARDQQLTTHIGRLRTQLMLNAALSGVAFAQYNSATDAVVLNGRIRWNAREGNDLYVVFNQGLNADRFDYDPVRPLTDNRTLLIKYSHTARF